MRIQPVVMPAIKTIALVAHDNRKREMVDWASWNKPILAQHLLCATGTTGALLDMEVGLSVTRFRSGPLGGDQQIGAGITEGHIDFVVFFWDPLESHSHDVDVKALLRIAAVYNIPIAATGRPRTSWSRRRSWRGSTSGWPSTTKTLSLRRRSRRRGCERHPEGCPGLLSASEVRDEDLKKAGLLRRTPLRVVLGDLVHPFLQVVANRGSCAARVRAFVPASRRCELEVGDGHLHQAPVCLVIRGNPRA